MKDLRDALFLRMFELLSSYSPFLFDSNQRKELADKWHEIAPSVENMVERIKSEDQP